MAATETDGRTAEKPKAQDAARGGSAKGGGSEPAKGDGAAQNPSPAADGEGLFDCQSECHCTKTYYYGLTAAARFDCQSECHCTKTASPTPRAASSFDCQSECHCTKTGKAVEETNKPAEAGLFKLQSIASSLPHALLHRGPFLGLCATALA